MGLGFAQAKVTHPKALVVEDDQIDRSQIARKLSSTPVFRPVLYNNYRKHPFMQRARDADIVSLDLEVENSKLESLYVCRQLKVEDPDKSVVFFTSNPKDVLNLPINFVLGKTNEVWEAYDRLLMMILVHDRSLSVLQDLVELSSDREQVRKQYEELREQLGEFIPSLRGIQTAFRKENKPTARRYRKLSRILKKMRSAGTDEDQIFFNLHEMQQPLMAFLRKELDELRKVEGVYVTRKLEDEIKELDESIVEQSRTITDTRSLKERAVVFAADKVSNSLKSVSRYLSPTKNVSEAAEAPETVEQSLYLNAWFHDHVDDHKLTVNEPAELRINLDYLTTQCGVSSEEIPADTACLLEGLESVDVLVMSPFADINPILQTLALPPQTDRFVAFTVIPLREGPLELTVLLLLLNQPIYRTGFLCEAAAAVEATSLSATSHQVEA
jgi:hypothetical protein